jgi:hypothetical protein
MNDDTKFKLELIVSDYSKIFDIGKKLVYIKALEYYFDHYENKLKNEVLSLNYSIKKLGKFCIKYKH